MIAAVLIAAALMQSPPSRFTVENSVAHAPRGMSLSFWAGYARGDAGDWVVEIYTRQFRGKGEYVLRRSLNTPDGREQATWTTSAACPVVLNIVPAMERLPLGGLAPAPRLEAMPRPWFIYPDWSPVQPHSPGYAVWGQGRQPDGAMSTYRVTAGNGLIAGFVERAEEALRPCWKDDLEA